MKVTGLITYQNVRQCFHTLLQLVYIKEMKDLQHTASNIYNAFMHGCFVARRSSGSHNAVSPDMILEQTYNADAKEESGLDGIADNDAARSKWILTKPITAEVSSKLKDMLNVHQTSCHNHHENHPSCILRDLQFVENIIACIHSNPFIMESDCSKTSHRIKANRHRCP